MTNFKRPASRPLSWIKANPLLACLLFAFIRDSDRRRNHLSAQFNQGFGTQEVSIRTGK